MSKTVKELVRDINRLIDRNDDPVYYNRPLAALLTAWRDEAVEDAKTLAAKQFDEFFRRQADDAAARTSKDGE